MNLFLVVMAGGSGTRFWPKSTSRKPKQLLSFGGTDPQSLLQQTLARFDGVVPADQRWIVTTERLSHPVTVQAPRAHVLAEPQGRNTAPCVYWAARVIADIDPNGIMIVMPSDHTIMDVPAFQNSVKSAASWAQSHDDLVTLGVKPTRPETGYGYLQIGRDLDKGPCKKVEAFVEKPNLSRAEEFVRSGKYLWNGGMFLWKASSILSAFNQFMPEMAREWDAGRGEVSQVYPKLTALSIDYGVMEKAKNVVTFPLDCGWDDLGSWTSLETLARGLGLDREGNVVTGGELVSIESSGNIIDAPGTTVALLGVRDLIIAQNGDALLVAHKDRAQDIKQVVDAVKRNHPELT